MNSLLSTQLSFSNYFLLCADNRITQLFKNTCLGVHYWRQHKNIKCYKCKKKGHLAKQCEQICYRCGNYHPTLPVCIFNIEKLFNKLIKLLEEKHKKTPYEKYLLLKEEIETFQDKEDEKYVKDLVKNTLKAEKVPELKIIKNINFEIKNRNKELIINKINTIEFKSKSFKNTYINLQPSSKLEIGYKYAEYNGYFKWLYSQGSLMMRKNHFKSIIGSLSITNNKNYEFIRITHKKYKNKEYKQRNNRSKSKTKKQSSIVIRMEAQKLADKNYYVRTPKHKEELIKSLIRSQEIANKSKYKKIRKLKEKHLYKIEKKFYQLKSIIKNEKEILKLNNQIKIIKEKKNKLKEDCNDLQEKKHDLIDDYQNAKEIGYSLINKAKEKANIIKDKAYNLYQDRAARRKHKEYMEKHPKYAYYWNKAKWCKEGKFNHDEEYYHEEQTSKKEEEEYTEEEEEEHREEEEEENDEDHQEPEEEQNEEKQNCHATSLSDYDSCSDERYYGDENYVDDDPNF